MKLRLGRPTLTYDESLLWAVHLVAMDERFHHLEPRSSPTVSSNLILSLMGVLSLSLAGSSAARAEPTSSDEGAGSQTQDSQTNGSETKASKKKSSKKKGSKTKDPLDALERGNPHSVDFQNREPSNHKTTNAEIQAGETANPDAIAK